MIDADGLATNLSQARSHEYGDYYDMAELVWLLKGAMHRHKQWHKLTAIKKESLDMIALKMARIINGNSSNIDSWYDIAGYARLIEEELIRNK